MNYRWAQSIICVIECIQKLQKICSVCVPIPDPIPLDKAVNSFPFILMWSPLNALFRIVIISYRIFSNCGALFYRAPPPLFFQPRSRLWYAQNLYFLIYNYIVSSMGHWTFSSSMLCVLPLVFTLFVSNIYEFKFYVLVFLILAPTQKLVLASGATIRDNTVYQK